MKVLIVGGGTGGHVIPALAIAREMRDRHSAEIRFIGTERGLETKLVPEAGFQLNLIRVGQLKNVSLMTRVKTMGDLPLGILRCAALIREFRPDVVVGVGGYVSGPGMLAAILMRVPTLAYEPNAVPGLVNRKIGWRVNAAAVAFPMTARFFRNASVTGVPVRQAIFEIGRKPLGELPQLLVTAGSQGAKIFNEIMPAIAGRLLEVVPGLRIMHQSGPRQYEETLAGYKAGGAEAHRWTVKPFLEDMPAQYAAADLVLARAGSTVAELAAAGRPSVLVPLPQAADDHQRKNAEVLAEAGAALMLLQADLTAETLLDELTSLLRNGSRLQEMGNHARSLAKPGAVEKIAKMIIGLAAGGSDPSDSAIHNRGHTNASSELR